MKVRKSESKRFAQRGPAWRTGAGNPSMCSRRWPRTLALKVRGRGRAGQRAATIASPAHVLRISQSPLHLTEPGCLLSRAPWASGQASPPPATVPQASPLLFLGSGRLLLAVLCWALLSCEVLAPGPQISAHSTCRNPRRPGQLH